MTAAVVGVLGLAYAAPANAATNLAQKHGTAGCITETGSAGACQQGRGLVGSTAIALSPEGNNAYVASSTWNSLSVIDRNPTDGTLTPIQNQAGCFYSNSPTFVSVYNLCTKVRQLAEAADVAVSPDGMNVYVAAPSDSAVAVFDREPATGELTMSSGADGCVNPDGSSSCTPGRALDTATALTVSPDGKNVYVASSGEDGGIAIFDRDPSTGTLTQKSGALGCINETGAGSCAVGPNQILGARAVALSPDGKTLYVVSATRQAVTIFSRDTITGDLTPLPEPGDCVKESGGTGCESAVAMIHPVSITVSPDGATAYVSAQQSHSIAIFDRDPATGELTQKSGTAGCISEGGLSDPMQAGTQGACLSGVAMRGISSVAILPDGSALYAAAQNSSGLDVFARAPDGTITQRPGTAGCITETGYENPSLPWTAGACTPASPLQSSNQVIASPDSEHVYTVAPSGNGGVGIFDVVGEPPPAGPPPPPPPPGKGRAALCEQALASLREAQHEVKLAESAIHKQSRARKKAKRVSAKQKLRGAIRRNRRQIKRWSQSADSAHREISEFCGNG